MYRCFILSGSIESISAKLWPTGEGWLDALRYVKSMNYITGQPGLFIEKNHQPQGLPGGDSACSERRCNF